MLAAKRGAVTQLAEQLVGRVEELACLERALGDLDDGKGRVVALSGEPGIGKTRLLSEVRRRADERGYLALSGRAAEFERDLPFGVLVDALDEYLASFGGRRLRQLGPELGAELAQIFPSLSELASERAPVLQDERYRAHRAVRELLERLAAPKPVVLLLDDLHWSDPASLELIAALLRRPPQAAVLAALALRPRQAPTRLSAAIDDAAGVASLERLELGPLSPEEAGRLLGEQVRGAHLGALLAESGGNPFYLEELARAERGGEPATEDGAPGERAREAVEAVAAAELPRAVATAVADEIGALSAAARKLLDAAAVAGDPFEPEVAAAAAEISEAEALGCIDELLRHDVVRQTEVPRRFRFRHPLLRRAVYQAAPGGWRLGAHERVARALEARGAAATTRAHHVEQSARPGDPVAIGLLREAGEVAKARAPASAARWLEAALRLLPEASTDAERAPGAGERVELLTTLAPVLAAVGRLAESRATLLELLALVPPDDVTQRVRLTAECAGVEHLLGLHRKARDRLEAALDELPDRASPEAVALMLELAMDGFYRMDYERMHEVGAQALEGAGRLDDRPLTAAANAILASGAAMAGRTPDAQSRASAAASDVDALPDSELADRLEAAAQLGWTEFYLERYKASIAHLERGIAVSRATGQGQRLPVMTEALACSLFMRGRLAEAAELQDNALEAARLSANPQRLSWALFNRAWTARLAGDLELALSAGEESAQLAQELDDSIVSALARAVLAVILIETDEVTRGVEELLAAAGGPELPLIPGPRKCVYYEPLTQAELRRGRPQVAARFAGLAEAAAQGLGLHVPTALAQRARAAVILETGDPLPAAKLALLSAAGGEKSGARLEAARSRTLAGRSLAAAGERQRATSELRAAAQELEACGATRYHDEAVRELRRLGVRIARRARPGSREGGGIASLTARERELAELVCDRKTNAQIAAELFLSQKTVESHLRNIFQKLGASSRVEVARAIERARREEGPTRA